MRSRTAGLEVHAGEADGGVAPDVDAELLRRRQLGAHGEAEPVAELRGLAPAEIGERRRRAPEGRELVARAAGVVGDDGVVAVHRVLQVPEHAVGVERRVVAGAASASTRRARARTAPGSRPTPCDGSRGDFTVAESSASSASSVSAGVAEQADLRPHVLVQVHRVEGGVDDSFGPFGIFTPKLVSVKEQPMPKTTSALSRKCRTGLAMARPPEPSESGCVLGEAALAAEAGGHRRGQQLRELPSAAARPRAQWTPVPA